MYIQNRMTYFNSRPRVEGVHLQAARTAERLNYFNSRPRVEGVNGSVVTTAVAGTISILALAWRASASNNNSTADSTFQFSPSRGGRPRAYQNLGRPEISILALAWRASKYSYIYSSLIKFQFSPSRGGRLEEDAENNEKNYFNSRPRVEGVYILASSLAVS